MSVRAIVGLVPYWNYVNIWLSPVLDERYFWICLKTFLWCLFTSSKYLWNPCMPVSLFVCLHPYGIFFKIYEYIKILILRFLSIYLTKIEIAPLRKFFKIWAPYNISDKNWKGQNILRILNKIGFYIRNFKSQYRFWILIDWHKHEICWKV